MIHTIVLFPICYMTISYSVYVCSRFCLFVDDMCWLFVLGLSGELINVLTDAKEDVPADLMKFGTAVKRKKHSMFGDFYRDDSRPMKAAVKVTFD